MQWKTSVWLSNLCLLSESAFLNVLLHIWHWIAPNDKCDEDENGDDEECKMEDAPDFLFVVPGILT